MSRIGKKLIPLPPGVKYTVEGNKGSGRRPKGKVSALIADGITLETKDGVLHVNRENEQAGRDARADALLVANAVTASTTGWKRELDIVASAIAPS